MQLSDFTHFLFGDLHQLKSEINTGLAEKYFDEQRLQLLENEFSNIPVNDIIHVISRTAECVADPKGRYYKEAMRVLPELLQYSPQMVDFGMKAFVRSNKPENLKQMTKQIGPNHHCLDYFVHLRHAKWQRAIPCGIVTHVAAGNIFLGSVGSLIQGILTKNINILKVSSQDFVFPSLFMQALEEVDTKKILLPYIGVTYWSRNNKDVESIVKRISDVILLFGGEDSVLQYKNGLSAKTEILSFGPKISYGVVCDDINEEKLKIVAEGFAKDIVIWEQRACTSCQNIFVEKGANSSLFASYLYDALENMAIEFPQKNMSPDTAVEIMKDRELLKWKEFQGEIKMFEGRSANHTVILQQSRDITDSPLNRTVFINEVNSFKDILSGNLKHMKYYMSTLAIASENKIQEITEEFMQLGVMRFVEPGAMAGGRHAELPHDGKNILQNLAKLINYETLPKGKFGLEYIDGEKKQTLMLSKINDILITSLYAPFYKEHFEHIKIPLSDISDFNNVPVLEKDNLFENSADISTAMQTSDSTNCYMFASGGTTSSPKYLLYSYEEFDEAKRIFGEGFTHCGITKGDVVANFLKAGAMYTGFLAVNAGLEETGCKILSITNNQSIEQTLEYLKHFSPNVLIGFPSAIIRLAQANVELNAGVCFEKILYAGEYISKSDIDEVLRSFHCDVLKSFGYAAVETGPIGYQCEHCVGTEHHVAEDWCRVDINEKKEVLVTVFGRKLFPVVKYNVGDLAEWVNAPCSCGRTSQKLRLLERSAKNIVLSASSISFQDIQTVLGKFQELSSIYQAVIDFDNERKVAIELFIETKHTQDAENTELQMAVENAFNTDIQALNRHREANEISKFSVKIVPSGDISSSDRTSKTKRVIDNRI